MDYRKWTVSKSEYRTRLQYASVTVFDLAMIWSSQSSTYSGRSAVFSTTYIVKTINIQEIFLFALYRMVFIYILRYFKLCQLPKPYNLITIQYLCIMKLLLSRKCYIFKLYVSLFSFYDKLVELMITFKLSLFIKHDWLA